MLKYIPAYDYRPQPRRPRIGGTYTEDTASANCERFTVFVGLVAIWASFFDIGGPNFATSLSSARFHPEAGQQRRPTFSTDLRYTKKVRRSNWKFNPHPLCSVSC